MYHITINIRATSTIYTATMEYLDKGGTLHTKTIQGGVKSTINQNAIQAAIDAVGILKGICLIEIHTDNDYLAGAVQNGWLKSWQENSWKGSKGVAVKHQDKWKQLAELMTRHTVRFTKVVVNHGESQSNTLSTASQNHTQEASKVLKAEHE